MTCLDKVMLDAFLEDRLSFEEKQEIQHHLMTCSSCLNRFEQYMDGLDMTDDVEEQWQTETIVQNVMEKLPAYPLKVLKTIEPQSSVRKNWKKRSVDIVKKTTIAVAGLAVIVTLGTAVSPTFASYVSGLYQAVGISSPVSQIKGPYANVSNQVVSLFDEKQTDRGILAAAAKGFVKPLDLKATDQGLTVEVKAVLADPLRLAILGSVTKQDALVEDSHMMINTYNVDEFREFRLKDKNGKVLTPFYKQSEVSAWMVLPNGQNFLIQRDLTNFFDEKNPLPDELIVELRVKHMGETKGTWNLDIPIDMRPAKAASKTVAINKQFSGPQETLVALQEVRYAPSGTQFVFSENKAGKGKSFLHYQLIDEKGTNLGSWEEIRERFYEGDDHPDTNMIWNVEAVDWYVTKKWIHMLTPIESTQKATMKLDAVFTEEKSSFRTKLNFAELEKKPIKAEGDGNQFTFQLVNKQRDSGHIIYTIKIEGTLAKDIAAVAMRTWKATDEHGKEAARAKGYMSKKGVQKDGRVEFSGELGIISEQEDLKEVTLSFDQMIKEHKVDWEIPLHPEK
ncbi:hypothetical protein J31TS6_53280 [Brevibacillus reuszeri]|uniref:DUF4179 domain-containing protein n=1 Tax=Brevibacillus reuszeri TaxID=54915 RepID=UPI001B18998E|nr:DUF4179 domain-containing protein [Brevibacillus reuszeri]GIO09300.1 hypothetical protein J31TS6_53280 [Brevibacillus reuszeri]